MSNAINTNYVTSMVSRYTTITRTSGKETEGSSMVSEIEKAANAAKRISKEDSTVTDFKRRRPQEAGAVDSMVNSGKKVLETTGASKVDTTEMTMDEYKQHITRVLDSIPFDASRPYDEETMFITDEGWEQMKNDPEYEAWVIGYTKQNRSVRNPFAGMAPGAGAHYGIEHFGASIDEHHGEGYSKTYGGTAAGARGLFDSNIKKGSIVKRAPQADAYPPKDYDIKKQQEKARQKKKQQEEDLENILYRREQTELWFQKKAQAQEFFAQALNSSRPVDTASFNVAADVGSAIGAYEASSLFL